MKEGKDKYSKSNEKLRYMENTVEKLEAKDTESLLYDDIGMRNSQIDNVMNAYKKQEDIYLGEDKMFTGDAHIDIGLAIGRGIKKKREASGYDAKKWAKKETKKAQRSDRGGSKVGVALKGLFGKKKK